MKTRTRNRMAGYTAISGCFWASYAVGYSFTSVFLLSKGYSSSEIGIVLAVGNILTLIFQPILAAFLDRSKKVTVRHALIALSSSAAIFTLVNLFFPGTRLMLCIIYDFMLLSLLLMQPLISSLCFDYIDRGYRINFGFGRGMGSMCYALISLSIGYIVDFFNETAIPICSLTLLSFTLLFLILYKPYRRGESAELLAQMIEQEKAEAAGKGQQSAGAEAEQVQPASFIGMFRRYPSYMLFVIGFVFVLYEHASLNNFLINIVEDVGGTAGNLGVCTAIAAALELPIMTLYGRFSGRINHRKVLMISALAFAVKGLCAYFAASVGQVILSQLVQAFGFASYSPAATYFANECMLEVDKVKGQAYMFISITSAGIIGSFLGGRIIDSFGVKTMLLSGVFSALFGFVLVFVALFKNSRGKKLFTR